MKEKFAAFTTAVVNPFLVSFAVIVLLACHGAGSPIEALKWAVLAIALGVLPVLVAVILLVRCRRLDGVFSSTRRQRNAVYLLASAIGAAGYVVLLYLGAPPLLLMTFATGFLALVVFGVVNFFWKISLHTAFIAGAVVLLVIVYGARVAWAVFLLPPVAWSRMVMGQHSLAQVLAGALLAGAIVLSVFWGYGVLGTSPK